MRLTRSGFVTEGDNKPLFAFEPQAMKGEYAYLTAEDIIELHKQLKLVSIEA